MIMQFHFHTTKPLLQVIGARAAALLLISVLVITNNSCICGNLNFFVLNNKTLYVLIKLNFVLEIVESFRMVINYRCQKLFFK